MDWSSGQYLKFEDARTRPARDLLAQVPLAQIESAIDLGCGPGNSTELVDTRFPGAQISGMDLDENMLAAAQKRLPHIPFFKADLATWLPEEPVDLLFSNAVFQWVPDQLRVLARLMGRLKPGGVLAIQMPDNLEEPSHTLMEETALEGPWADRFSSACAKRNALPSPAHYVDALGPFSADIDVWHTVYNHPMETTAAIAEWFKGSALKPWLDRLDEADRPTFVENYVRKLDSAYPPLADGRVLLRFPRLFVVAIRK